jgi:hypothetical protein
MSVPIGGCNSEFELRTEPDGQGVVARFSNAEEGRLWRWRDGQWTELALPARKLPIVDYAPRRNGVLLFFRGTTNTMAFLSYDTGKQDKMFDVALAEIAANDFKTREQATARMIALGYRNRRRAEKALRETDDPEVEMRLRSVLSALMADRQASNMVLERTAHFGAYEATNAVLQFCDETGRVGIGAPAIRKDDQFLGPGMLIEDSHGFVTFLGGQDYATSWRGPYFGDSGVVWGLGKQWVWVPDTQKRLDLSGGTAVCQVPSVFYRWFHAALGDGTVFVSSRGPHEDPNTVARFNPAALDNRLQLQATGMRIADRGCCVSRDGVVWACSADTGPVRYAGKKWEEIRGFKGRMDCDSALTSQTGIIIPPTGGWTDGHHASPAYLLTSDGDVFEESRVEDLILKHRELVARVFGASSEGLVAEARSPFQRIDYVVLVCLSGVCLA